VEPPNMELHAVGGGSIVFDLNLVLTCRLRDSCRRSASEEVTAWTANKALKCKG